MQLSLRPYVTTGVALVGASVIAAAPITPTPADIQIPNPAVQTVERGVQLTANEIQTAVNKLVFVATKAGVSVAQLTTPLVAQILGISETEAAGFLAVGTIGLLGPLISGTGAVGTALQRVVDSDGLEELLVNLVGAPGTIIGGLVNGNYGPDLAPLITTLTLPAAILAGGLINPGNLPFPVPSAPPWTVPGAIPTLQGLVEQLFGLFSPAATMSVQTAGLQQAPTPDSTIEDGINSLVFALTKATLSVVTLAAPLVAPILGVSEPEAEAFLALGTVGLLGPIISGTGAAGAALQNIVNSHGVEGLLTSLIGAPGTLADGVVNGGYGPNLQSILPLPNPLPTAGGPLPITGVFAPGLIQNPGYNYALLANTPLAGIGLQFNAGGASMLPPSTTAVLQGLVERVFGALPSNQMASAFKAPAGEQKISSQQDNLTLNENKGGTDLEGKTPADGPEVTPKKNRPHFNLNVLNPLGNLGGAKKADEKDTSALGSDNATTAKHRPGLDKTPVGRLIHRVLSGGHDSDDDDNVGQQTDDAPAAE